MNAQAGRGVAEPLLKWPGGKRWIAATIAEIIQPHLTGTYFEPFFGSGAVFFALAPAQSILSDSNAELMHCYRAVKANPSAILKCLWRLSNSRSCFHRVRNSRPRLQHTAAARFVYLNRTCWGGIYRVNKKGEFNSPFGNSGRYICRKRLLFEASAALQSASLRVGDFEKYVLRAGAGDVAYIDPPYAVKSDPGGFLRYNSQVFTWRDQVRLARACEIASKNGATLVLSLPWDTDVLSLYSNWTVTMVERCSRVSKRRDRREIIQEAIVMKQPIHQTLLRTGDVLRYPVTANGLSGTVEI